MKEIIISFQDQNKAYEFLNKIKENKPRYIRDQLLLIQNTLTERSQETINQALDFCIQNDLYSAVDFKDAASHYSKVINTKVNTLTTDVIPLSPNSAEKIKAKPQIRDINEYTKIFNK